MGYKGVSGGQLHSPVAVDYLVSVAAGHTKSSWLADLWHWMMLPDVTNAVTWIGTVVGLIGLGFGLYGLRLTFVEARNGRRASELATRAVAAAEQRMSIGNYAYAYAQAGLVRDLVDAGDTRPASPIFQMVKRFVHETRPGSSGEDYDRDDSPVGIALRTVEFQIGKANREEKYNARAISKSLSVISDHLARLEREQTKVKPDEEP